MFCLVAELTADHVTLKHILKEAGDLTSEWRFSLGQKSHSSAT